MGSLRSIKTLFVFLLSFISLFSCTDYKVKVYDVGFILENESITLFYDSCEVEGYTYKANFYFICKVEGEVIMSIYPTNSINENDENNPLCDLIILNEQKLDNKYELNYELDVGCYNLYLEITVTENDFYYNWNAVYLSFYSFSEYFVLSDH